MILLCRKYLILIHLLYIAHACGQSVEETSHAPNFIVFLCDNLGYGDIEPFGSSLHRTPHLTRMAKEGRRFTHFYTTAGVCTPSRASLLTGCYAQRIGMHTNERDGRVLRPISPYGLHPEEVTIAEVLKTVGYKTGLIGKWHLGDQDPFLPSRQGFDYFYGVPYSDDMTRDVGKKLGRKYDGDRWPPLPVMLNEKVVQAGVDRNLLTQDYTGLALDFIEKYRRESFFLFLSHAMPGSTSTPFASKAFKGKSKNGPWGDSVEELDWSLGQIMELLRELAIDRRTLLIFTSDNGAPMIPDLSSTVRGTNAPLCGRGYNTSEGAFRAPTIMWWPGTVPAGGHCQRLVTMMDLLPTFAHFADASIPMDRVIDGYNISAHLLGTENVSSPYEVLYYYDQEQLQAVRRGPWKLFVSLDDFDTHPHFRNGIANTTLLFNVEEDVSCTHNVASEHPQVVRELMDWVQCGREELGDVNQVGKSLRPRGVAEHPQPVVMD